MTKQDWKRLAECTDVMIGEAVPLRYFGATEKVAPLSEKVTNARSFAAYLKALADAIESKI